MSTSYAELTTADANPLKRFVQRRRLADALRILGPLPTDARPTILDYGGADGQLSRLIAARLPRSRIVCYEPTPHLAAEAQRRLAGLENAAVLSAAAELEPQQFDYCFCLEVFEHLPEPVTQRTLDQFERLLAPGGTCVIGVPNEIHLAALLKGMFRMARRPGQFDTRLANILRTTIGRPPLDRPLGEIAPGLAYHFFHLGFDHRRLRRMLGERFSIQRTYGSPLPWAPLALNSEVYFVVRRNVAGSRSSWQ
jgi:SAM-dependent methyltransferase